MKRTISLLLLICLLLTGMQWPAQAAQVNRYSILVLDESGSMQGAPMDAAKQAAISFCEQVLKAKGNNQIAVIGFTYSPNHAVGFTNNMDELSRAINSLYAFGGTSQYSGLNAAKDLFAQTKLPKGAIKNILLMSDGLPEGGMYSSGTKYTNADYPYYYDYANAAYDIAVSMHADYNIYTLGFFHSSTGNDLEFGRRFMKDLQNKGYYEVNDPDKLVFEFGNIAEDIGQDDTKEPKKGTFRYHGSFHGSKDSSTEYAYSDSFFKQRSTQYSNDLAIMSLCLAMSTFSSGETNIWSNKSQNAKALLMDELGFQDFAQSSGWNSSPSMNSIGVVTAWKMIDGVPLLAVSIRGGGYYDEWGGNFLLGQSGHHEGFERAADQVLTFLEDYLKTHQDRIRGRIKIWMVGYSRSGAVANAVAGKLSSSERVLQDRAPSVSLAAEDLFCYAFEAPKGIAKGSYQAYENTGIHNITNKADLVPYVAPGVWGFTRANRKNEIIFPYVTTKNYQNNLKKMLSEYDIIVNQAAVEEKHREKTKYKVRDYTRTIKIDFEMKRFLVLWYPTVSIQIVADKSLPYHVALSTLLDDVGAALKSREHYRKNVEKTLTQTVSDMMGTKNSNSLSLFFDQLTLELFDNYFRGLHKILAPYANPLVPIWDKDKQAERALVELGDDAARKVGTGNPLRTVKSLSSAVAKLVVGSGYNLLKVMDTSFFITPSKGRLFQPHFPEVTLAWLRSQSSAGQSQGSAQTTPGLYRVIRINCPVDLKVYNNSGKQVASMKNNAVVSAEHGVSIGSNEAGEKTIFLPADEGYTINITATDQGLLNYTVHEYSELLDTYTRMEAYFDIPIEKGDLLRGIVPMIAKNELSGSNEHGSSVEYKLLSARGHALSPSVQAQGSDIRHYEVTATSNNTGGVVWGGGRYLVGSFAKLDAYPVSTGEFLGWYENGQLLSQDSEYRFAVVSDRNIEGRFKPVKYHKLTFAATQGGKVLNEDGQYPAGTELLIACEAEPGYIFSHWDTFSDGKIADKKALTTTYIMPDKDSTVTAVFIVDPATMPPLTGDQAPLGQYGLIFLLAMGGLAGTVMMVRRNKRKDEN